MRGAMESARWFLKKNCRFTQSRLGLFLEEELNVDHRRLYQGASLTMPAVKGGEPVTVTFEVGISTVLRWRCGDVTGTVEATIQEAVILKACIARATTEDKDQWLIPHDTPISTPDRDGRESIMQNPSVARSKLNGKIQTKLSAHGIKIDPLFEGIHREGYFLNRQVLEINYFGDRGPVRLVFPVGPAVTL